MPPLWQYLRPPSNLNEIFSSGTSDALASCSGANDGSAASRLADQPWNAGVGVALSLEPRHLPHESVMIEARTKSAFRQHFEHRGRRMGEGPELSP
jgi:hypothetical protein